MTEGRSVFETAVKEGAEEAGLTEQLAAGINKFLINITENNLKDKKELSKSKNSLYVGRINLINAIFMLKKDF